MLTPTISYLTDIYFDEGALKLLPTLLQQYGLEKPLVITDQGLVALGIIPQLDIGMPVFYDRVETNPTGSMVTEALAKYREEGCDSIIAVGGGSPIDLAKCVAILVNHPLPLEDYAIIRGGLTKITANIPPLIAIPTTAGSGSEVGRAALLTIEGIGKLGFLSKFLIPVATICDPGLTIGLPPLLTAGTGMDAISHCLEAFCSPRYNPVADAIALDGLERGFRNLVTATHNGNDHQARSEMMMCSLQGGMAFQKGLGAVHSLSHPLGALREKRLHHGTLNAIFLPVVLKFNYSSCKNKMELIAERLKIKDALSLPGHFIQLIKELGLPARLRELGLTKEELGPLAGKAHADHCTPTNPGTVTVKDFMRLYLEAL